MFRLIFILLILLVSYTNMLASSIQLFNYSNHSFYNNIDSQFTEISMITFNIPIQLHISLSAPVSYITY